MTARVTKISDPRRISIGRQGATRESLARTHEQLRAKSCSWAATMRPIIEELAANGITTPTRMAKVLTARKVRTVRGSTHWQTVQVQRLLARLPK